MSTFYDADMAARQERMARTVDMVEQRAQMMRVLAPEPGERVLELGSGNGIFTRDLIGRVGEDVPVVGLDSSEAIIGMARHLCPQGEFVMGDAQDLPFEEASFDAVAAAQLLCFLPDVDLALSEAFRVLGPGGRIVILDTDWDTLVWRSGVPELMDRVLRAYTSFYADARLPMTLPERMARAGFEQVSAEGFVVLNTSFDEDTYARQTAGFALPIMEGSEAFSADDRRCWIEDLERLDREGGFFFSLNRYLISGRKPDAA